MSVLSCLIRCSSLNRLCVAAAMLAASAHVHAAPVLIVDTLDGEATGNLLGETRRLAAGDVIREREVLHTGPAARLSLVFADQGLLELGADARLAIEKLPTAANARDLRSLVSLEHGYLRVLWTPTPERAARWPFVLFYGGHRSTLQPGEYFFERQGGLLRSCVASGRLTVSAIAGDDVEMLAADACYDLAIAEPAQRTAYPATRWEWVRRAFSTDSKAIAAAAARPVAAPQPSAPPPAIATEAKPTLAAVPPPPAPTRTAAAPAGVQPAGVQPAGVQPAGVQPAGWTLLVGSYADPANAEQVAARLRSVGFTPFTRIKDVDGRTWHSVQVRGLPSREVAEASAAEVRERLAIDAVRVVRLN